MRTEKQREASRRNGALSRGPVTPAGKARSARNSITHGLFARDVVLAGENREHYDALLLSFVEEWEPRTNTEYMLVTDMASCCWRLLRAESHETALTDVRVDSDGAETARITGKPDERVRSAFAAQRLTDSSGILAQLDRQSTRLSRQFERSMRMLERLRNCRNLRDSRDNADSFCYHEPDNLLKTREDDSPQNLETWENPAGPEEASCPAG